ncbi:uncharacterized protein LOC124934511 [Impatiens glandulifera]|uniref:uncharacterized protein LOC124934511 n=1 Tax=Impatiens glandulifera TaxID=253017 RepID=UPI001FB11ECA|nr:uncharacterized protein LOC124934511 [Impatiens glandulifera]
MDLTSDLFLLISISAILTSFSSLTSANALPPEIKTICDKTSSPDICSSSIVPFLDGKSKDIASVLRMQIMATMDTIETAIKESKKHSKELHKEDKIGARRIKDCGQLYSSAISDYKNALKALKENNFESLQTELDAGRSMISTCDDTVTGDRSLPDSVNPLNKINLSIKKMTGNCYDLKNLMKPLAQPHVI